MPLRFMRIARNHDVKTKNNRALMRHISLVLLIAVSMVGHAEADTELAWRELNQKVIEQHILPAYKDFAEASTLFQPFVEQLCINNNRSNAEILRSLFSELVLVWQHVQHIKIGPIQKNERLPKIQLWPDRHDSVTEQVAGMLDARDLNILIPEVYESQSASVQGLPVLERLLFEQKSIDDYECGIMLVVAINLQKQAEAMLDEWQGESPETTMGGYAKTLIETGSIVGTPMPSDGNEALYKKPSELSAEFLKTLIKGFVDLEEYKINPALNGEDSAPSSVRAESAADKKQPGQQKAAKPKQLEFWRSRLAMESMLANLESFQDLYTTGFSPLVASYDADLDEKIKSHYKAVIRIGKSFDEPLYDTLASGSLEEFLAFRQALIELRTLVTAKLPKVLGLSIGFNAKDGD